MAELSACRASPLAPVTPLISHTWHSHPMTALPHLNHVGRGALSPACLMSVPLGDRSMLITPYILGSYISFIIICKVEDHLQKIPPSHLMDLQRVISRSHFVLKYWHLSSALFPYICLEPSTSVSNFLHFPEHLLTNHRESLWMSFWVQKCKFVHGNIGVSMTAAAAFAQTVTNKSSKWNNQICCLTMWLHSDT